MPHGAAKGKKKKKKKSGENLQEAIHRIVVVADARCEGNFMQMEMSQ